MIDVYMKLICQEAAKVQEYIKEQVHMYNFFWIIFCSHAGLQKSAYFGFPVFPQATAERLYKCSLVVPEGTPNYSIKATSINHYPGTFSTPRPHDFCHQQWWLSLDHAGENMLLVSLYSYM